jgi:hypothetical protein
MKRHGTRLRLLVPLALGALVLPASAEPVGYNDGTRGHIENCTDIDGHQTCIGCTYEIGAPTFAADVSFAITPHGVDLTADAEVDTNSDIDCWLHSDYLPWGDPHVHAIGGKVATNTEIKRVPASNYAVCVAGTWRFGPTTVTVPAACQPVML